MTVVAALSPPSARLFGLASWVGTYVVVQAIIFATSRNKGWTMRAQRLARDSGIELPHRLMDRIARRLRNEWLVGVVILPLWFIPLELSTFVPHIQSPTFWHQWFPRLVILAPLFGVAMGFVSVIVARWNVPRLTRLSHFRKVRLHQAFTGAERCVLVAGVGSTMVVSAWGLHESHSSIHWWLVDFGALVVAGVLWWILEEALLDHPSTASDPIELAWDDLFRFRRVRSLAIGAAWIPPMAGMFLVFLMNQAIGHHNLGPPFVYGSLVSVTVVVFVFRQGRQLWRTA